MFYVLCGVVASGVAISFWLKRKQIVTAFQIVRYELLYWALGVLAVGDDLIWSWKNKLKETPKRSGDVAIVTGGARGIGLEVVKVLLKCDMTVVLACRDVVAGEAAVRGIRTFGITTGTAHVLPLDTASQAAVKKFVQLFLAKFDKLHLLINNAGVMFVPYKLTEDGFESHLAVNYLGHFTLTHLLTPVLAATGRASQQSARVVNVSSCAHLPGSINFDDINYERNLYIPSQAYAQSKLAQIMFTKAVCRRFNASNLPVSIFSLHPGVVNTDLFDGTFLKTFLPWMPGLFFKRPDQGATTTLYVGLSSDLKGKSGQYFANCHETFISSTASDEEQQERLMKMTCTMLSIQDFANIHT